MDGRTFNESGSPTLLFVMGFGNRFEDASVTWFIDRLTDAGYRVHALELPTDITDFEREYRRPVQRAHDTADPAAVLSHSLGGLVAASLDTAAKPVYLSPWWGIYEGKVSGWQRWIIPRLPITARIIPVDTQREELGAHLSDAEWKRIPDRISPVYITEIYRAQQQLPPIGKDAVVFVSLSDTIVSPTAVGKAVSAAQIRLYDGGHQLFAAADREAAVADVLAELPE